jgi:hypothetical protein
VIQVCSGTSATNHQKWSEQIRIIPQINNIKNSAESFSSRQNITEARVINKQHITEYSIYNQSYQICLDYSIPDSLKRDDDLMMSCPDRICSECGNDHNFRGNFENIETSIDILEIR